MSNLNRLQQAVRDSGLASLLLSDINNVSWATGFSGSFGYLLITPDEARFLTDSRYTIAAGQELAPLPVYSFASPKTFEEFLAEQVAEIGITSLGFEASHVTYATLEKWRQKLGGVDLAPIPDIVGDLRLVKTPDEIEKIRKACAVTDACFDHILRMIQPGVSEFDIGLHMEFFMRRQGAEVAFAPVVVSGHRSARPHGRASEKLLESGDFLTLDFGAKVEGYCADMTRTVVVGEATDRHREMYEITLKAQLACLDAMKPGVPAKQVDAIARTVFDEKGYAKYFGHGLGHGLGRLVHDSGRMNPTSEFVLQPGQVWTVEPGIYIEGFGGVRIEDDVVVTDSGIEILNHSPKEMLVLPS